MFALQRSGGAGGSGHFSSFGTNQQTLLRVARRSVAFAFTAVFTVVSPVAEGGEGGVPDRPNIVFILADDVGARDLGCYGSVFHQTPNIDALAGRGVRLTQAYASSSVCSPTRSSIMTGLHPARLGLTTAAGHKAPENLAKRLVRKGSQKLLVADEITRLDTKCQTIAEVFRDAGYRTGHFGKWHLGKEPYSPLEQGFEIDWPHTHRAGPGNSYFAPWDYPGAGEQTAGEHVEDRLSREAVEWMTQHKDEPFFLNYWSFSAHGPWIAKDDYVAEFAARVDPNDPQRNPVYAAMLRSLDEAVGTLVEAIDRLGIADRTIIVFFSDNGGVQYLSEANREKYQMEAHATSNLPFRAGKGSIYEGGLRVPCLVVWPDVTEPGSTSEALLQSVDFLPTLAEIAGLDIPGSALDGMSQVPALREGKRVRKSVFSHFPHGKGRPNVIDFAPATMVRRGNYKLIRFYGERPDLGDNLELYHLGNDPGETLNLAKVHPEIASYLNWQIDGFLRETDAVVPRISPNWNGFRKWRARAGSRLREGDGKATLSKAKGRPCLQLGLPAPVMGSLELKIRINVAEMDGDLIVDWSTTKESGRKRKNRVRSPVGKTARWKTHTVSFTPDAPLKGLWLTTPGRARIDWIRITKRNGVPVGEWGF